MSLFIIENHPLYREALAALVRRIRPEEEVVELDRLGHLPMTAKTHGAPSVVCLDLTLSDTLGFSGIREIKHHFPETLVVVVSDELTPDDERLALEAGADAYLSKLVNTNDLLTQLRGLLLPEGAADDPLLTGGKLSKRQVQLLTALEQGLSNRDIAERLGISEHTVKVHLWRLFRRLGVKSRTQAIHTARTHGLLKT